MVYPGIGVMGEGNNAAPLPTGPHRGKMVAYKIGTTNQRRKRDQLAGGIHCQPGLQPLS